MARKDTFFLRTNISTDSTNFVSDTIDISAYTDPARGRVLVVDRGFITIDTDGEGPVKASDVVASGTGGKSLGIQCTTESQTGLVETSNNSLFMKMNFYASVATAGILTMVHEESALNPAQYVSGFVVPTDGIHVGCRSVNGFADELDIGFLFEVHTEKLSLSRIQELLVSLTAN
jgi:hypothetical protein